MANIIKMFYDTETTGVDPKKHSIIQLSGIIEVNGEIKEEFDFLVRPHEKAKIEDEAFSVNGRTREEILGFPEMKTVYKQLINMLEKYVDRYNKHEKIFLVGFNNLKFDDEFLRMFFSLNGNEFFNSIFWSGSIDVMALASQYLLDRRIFMSAFKQKRVAIELGIEVADKDLHDAVYDVKLLRQIYRIVSLEIEEPAKQFYYYVDVKLKSAFKTFQPYWNMTDRIKQVSFIEYKEYLFNMPGGKQDGPEWILHKPIEQELGDLF